MPDLPLQPQKHRVSGREREAFLTWLWEFLGAQKTLILATCSYTVPACNLMSFALASAECALALATPRETAKHEAMRLNPAVSLMALDAPALEQDLDRGTAVTLDGEAVEILDARERERWEVVFTEANPRLEEFVQSPRSALFRVDLLRAVSVTNFQQISEITLRQGPPSDEGSD
jgi:hypothetical protein